MSDHIISTDAILRQNSGGCQTSKDALKEAPWHLKRLALDTPLSVSIQSPKKTGMSPTYSTASIKDGDVAFQVSFLFWERDALLF
jgi:hypothetical protein